MQIQFIMSLYVLKVEEAKWYCINKISILDAILCLHNNFCYRVNIKYSILHKYIYCKVIFIILCFHNNIFIEIRLI